MRRKYLLDTNVIIDHICGSKRIPKAVSGAETMFVSQVVIAETKAGLDDTARGRRDREALDAFLRLPNVVEITLSPATTDLYAMVFRSLREAGRPIPVNDIWLAAQALEHGAVLVSRDRHFEAVANLQTLIPED
ncbi:MAG: PIN domain-containing protein [Kiritimatiellae bacterium]|nr:PIN domain-containing protein [Kiritimatiellia bacterium]